MSINNKEEMVNTILTTKHSGTVVIGWMDDSIAQVTIGHGTTWEKTITRSYLDDGKIVFSREDAPSGTIWPMSRCEIEEISLMGGKVNLHADDLYGLTVMPEWWTMECEMATESECPEWPMSEDIPQKSLGEVMLDMIRHIIENSQEWDVLGDEEEGDK